MALNYFLIALGIFEILSNVFHISKKTVDKIGKSAKIQHQELTLTLPNIHFFYKAIVMLIFGFLFLITGLLSVLKIPFASLLVFFVLACFGIYGIIQAIIYKTEIKVWSAMVVYNIPLLISIFVKP